MGVGGAGVVVEWYIQVTANMQLCGRLQNMYIPLACRETILETLVLLLRPPLALTQMVYFVSHWRLDKVALVAVVLSTVYIIRKPPSGW